MMVILNKKTINRIVLSVLFFSLTSSLSFSSFTEFKDTKEGYITTYFFVPNEDNVDINDSDKFKVNAVNDKEEILTLADPNGESNPKKNIIIEDLGTFSENTDFKVIEVKTPSDSSDTIKISAGFLHNSTNSNDGLNDAVINEYVFLLDESIELTDEQKSQAAGDPFYLIEAENSDSFEEFLGVKVSNSSRFFMTAIRDTSVPTNYDAGNEFYGSIDFEIDDKGNIIPKSDFTIIAKLLGVEFHDGGYTFPEIFSSVTISEDNTIVRKFKIPNRESNNYNLNYKMSYDRRGRKIKSRDYLNHNNASSNPRFPLEISISKSNGEPFKAGSPITVQAGASGYANGITTGSTSKQFDIYKLNQIIYTEDVPSGGNGQEDFNYFINGLLTEVPNDYEGDDLDLTKTPLGRVTGIAPSDILVLFDYNNSNRDYQDTIVLITLIPEGEAGVINHITVINDKLMDLSKGVDMESNSSSNTNKSRESEVKFHIKEKSQYNVEFEIESIDE